MPLFAKVALRVVWRLVVSTAGREQVPHINQVLTRQWGDQVGKPAAELIAQLLHCRAAKGGNWLEQLDMNEVGMLFMRIRTNDFERFAYDLQF